MISLKDIPVYLSIAGTVFGGGVYINDIRRDVAELGKDYRSHVSQQQGTSLIEKRWKIEDRIRQRPNDLELQRDLDEVNRLIDINNEQQRQLKGGK